MNKTNLEVLIERGLSQRQLADELKISQSTIKYWLKKYSLKTNINQFNKKDDNEKYCPKCETVKSVDDFYKRYNRTGYGGYCKSCSNEYHSDRVRDVKIRMIYHKGGKCVDCNLTLEDSHYCVFDFHHLDPKGKDINFDRIKYKSWDKIEKELTKCVLLCSNCHRLRHALMGKW